MTDKRPSQTADDVLKALHEFLLGEEPDFRTMPIEKVQEYLNEAGVDPKPTMQAIRKQIQRAKGAKALQVARERRQEKDGGSADAGIERAHALLTMGRDQLIAQLQALVGLQQAAVYMRKFENPDDDDLRSLIDDIEALGDDTDAEG